MSHFLLAALLPAAAAAQATRDDGLRALAAGDYARAVEILRPLAEDPQSRDGVAQFLMAVLYDTGKGTARNGLRACGLFLKAARTPGPFVEQAVQLARALREEGMPPEFCRADGEWRDVPPAVFSLGPDHTVTFAENAIVIRYHGAERKIMTGGLPDSRPLPIIYTPLDVTSPSRVRRHFLQSFIWWRDTSSTWTLGWILSEVAGAELVPVTGERSLTTVTTTQPPDTIDLAALARVRISSDGQAEWVIAAGANPRSAIIDWKDPR